MRRAEAEPAEDTQKRKKRRIQQAVSFAILCLIAGGMAFGQEENLVRGRRYAYWPQPSYGDCLDEEDKTQLTDGETKYAGTMWVNKSCVGWASGIDVPIVMQFDLGEEATLNELRFNTCGGGGAGVVEVGLRVFVSLDDQAYVPAGEHKAPVPKAGQNERYGVQIKVPLGDARARYVAVAAMAPAPHYFVFMDEIQIMGRRPADAASQLPVQSALIASGARSLQELLAGGKRAGNLMEYLTRPVLRHIENWPAELAAAQKRDVLAARQRVISSSGGGSTETSVIAETPKPDASGYEQVRAALTAAHRDRARQVYGRETLVWETFPDDAATMLSMPLMTRPAQTASVHTAINALEATALGAANLTEKSQPLKVVIEGKPRGGPTIAPRVGRYCETTNARYVPDPLLLTDSPVVIPSGESRLIWIGVESTGARPGVYDYTVNVTIGDATHSIPLKVHVHHVTLSRETPLWTGNWSDLNSGEHPLFDQVRDSMLTHRITIGAGTAYPRPKQDANGNVIRPVAFDLTDMDKMLAFHKDFPMLTIFVSFDAHGDRPQRDWFGPSAWMSDEFQDIFGEWLTGLIGRFKAAGRGYDRFAIMFFDETLDHRVAQVCELAHQVDPRVRTMITHSPAGLESVRAMAAAGMNIFAHHAPRTEYEAESGYEFLRSGGRELWFYGAADAAYGGGKERDPLGFFRHLHWTAFRHGATGVHFWNMLHNNGGGPMWEPETNQQNYWPMVYPNHPRDPKSSADVQTAEQVIPSRRWEYVRMGIEDYLLLAMAQERLAKRGEAAAETKGKLEEILKTVIINRDTDRALFRAKRLELLELVESLSEDNP